MKNIWVKRCVRMIAEMGKGRGRSNKMWGKGKTIREDPKLKGQRRDTSSAKNHKVRKTVIR